MICLIDQNDRCGRELREELRDVFCRRGAGSWIVRVADINKTGAVCRSKHLFQVVTVVRREIDLDDFSAGDARMSPDRFKRRIRGDDLLVFAGKRSSSYFQ